MAKKTKTRKVLSSEEKTLKALHGLFILHAAQLQIGGKEMRQILGIGMNEITPTLKIVLKAIKKQSKAEKKQ